MHVRLPPLGVFVCESICALSTGSTLSRWHHLGFFRIGLAEAWTSPCGQLGLWRTPGQSPNWMGLRVSLWRPPGLCSQPRCAGGLRPHTLLWGGQPNQLGLSSCTRGMVETEVGKGAPHHPELPLPPGCFGGRRMAGNYSQVSLASLAPSHLLLTTEAFSQPSLLEAVGGLGCHGQLLFACAARELRPPCQWQRPKPQF